MATKKDVWTEDFNPISGDKILYPILMGTKNNWFFFIVTYTLVALGGSFLLSYVSGTALPSQGFKGVCFVKDYGNLLNIGIVLPLGMLAVRAFYLFVTNGIYRLLEEKILIVPTDEEKVFLEKCEEIINRPWAFILALLCSVALNIFISAKLHGAWNSFRGNSFVAPAYFRVFASINFTLTFYMLFKGIQTVQMVRFIFTKEIQLQPLHPDRCSGLLPIGKIAGAINLFIALVTVYLSVLVTIDGISLKNPLFLSVIGFFILLATYLFFGPLIFAHKRMKQQKKAMLDTINHQFQDIFEGISAKLQQENPSLTLEEMQTMEQLEKLHQVAMKMPVWPFNMEAISKFFAVGIGPIVVAIAKTFLKTKGK